MLACAPLVRCHSVQVSIGLVVEFDYIPLNLKLVLSFEAQKAINLFNKVNLGCTKQSGKAHRGGCGRKGADGRKDTAH